MIELIKYVVNRFAEKPEEIEYDVKDDGKEISFIHAKVFVMV